MIRPFALGFLALAVPGIAHAQAPVTRLTDINTAFTGPAAITDRIGDYLFIREMVTAGGLLWFTAHDGIHGVELWATDGTAPGTRRITDLCPGRCSAHPRALTAFGSRLFFVADDGVHGSEPWISDGTSAGTTMLADVWPGLRDGGGYGWAVATDTVLVFGGTTPGEGWEPWVSDGSPAGTRRLADLRPGPESSLPFGVGRLGSLAFFSADDGIHGEELWRTDGTIAGTIRLDINPGPLEGFDDGGNLAYRTATTPEAFFFMATGPGLGRELWRTDGTISGTRLVRDLQPGPGFGNAFWLSSQGGRVFFVGDDGVNGYELWVSDGTDEGTTLVIDLSPGPGGASPQGLVASGGGIFFTFQDAFSGERHLYFSDGTATGTRDLAEISTSSFLTSVAVGSGVIFHGYDGAHGSEPWFSDGSQAGTFRLADLAPGPESSFETWDYVRGWLRCSLAGRGYFWAYSPGSDFELWSSDGTPAGTRLVADVNAMASSLRHEYLYDYVDLDYQPVPPAATPDGLVFLATDGPLDPSHLAPGTTGLELWSVEHVTGAVASLGDLEPGPASSFPSRLVELPSEVVFPRRDELWRTAGSLATTMPIPSTAHLQVSSLARAERAVVFSARTNGIAPGNLYGLPYDLSTPIPLDTEIPYLDDDGRRVYYRRFGGELVVTDGTSEGTVQLTAAPHPGVSSFSSFGGGTLFAGFDDPAGHEPWFADGSPESARLLADLHPGPASSLGFGNPLNVEWPGWGPPIRTAGTHAYFTADDGAHGQELWATDGTAPGTRLVADLFPGVRGAEVRRITAIGSRIFFVADDGVHGRELWVSDGTAAGTRLVRNLAPGPGSAVPQELTAIGSYLVFNAWTPQEGRELWISDGTALGTRRLVDVAPGPASSSPVGFVAAGGWLYFTANDNVTGDELWRLPLSLLQPAAIFADGFESGGIASWSLVVP